MMEGKQVEDVTVDLSEGLLYIVPKDGYVYTAENGTAYTKSTDQDGKAFTLLPTRRQGAYCGAEALYRKDGV